MQHDQRMIKAAQLFEKALQIQNTKGKAYAGRDADGLKNFKEAAERTGLSIFQVWAVYATKHFLAIENAIKENPQDPQEKTETMEGRILDAINYLSLLHLLLLERKENNHAS